MNSKNIYMEVPAKLPKELFEIIAKSDNVKIERIVSEGHTSPKDFWYDQDQNEFVILLKGNAKLEFDDGSEIELNEGDYFIIPAHKRHRVSYTDNLNKTIWLAVHY